MTNPFKKTLDKLSDRALRKEADRAEAVAAEIRKREEIRGNAEAEAEAEARAKKNAETISTLKALAASTAVEIAEATARLDAAVRGLAAFEERDGLLVRHAGLMSELRFMGEKVRDAEHPRLSEEALAMAERVWTPLGISFGVAVVARPLLTFK